MVVPVAGLFGFGQASMKRRFREGHHGIDHLTLVDTAASLLLTKARPSKRQTTEITGTVNASLLKA